MADRFLDTNILLRHLLGDHPAQSPASRELIRSIENGHEICWTTDLVIAEVVWVLSNKTRYNLPRTHIGDILLPLIDLPGLKIVGKRRYLRVFDLYSSTSLSFIDCFHAAAIEAATSKEIYSYDQGFDRVPGITRLQPAEVTDHP